MANDTLLGQTDSVVTYDGSGVFKPTYGDEKPEDTSYDRPEESEILIEPDESKKPDESVDENTDTSTNTLLMYGGAALLLYYFFFKKK
jgi:hypothetical protein